MRGGPDEIRTEHPPSTDESVEELLLLQSESAESLRLRLGLEGDMEGMCGVCSEKEDDILRVHFWSFEREASSMLAFGDMKVILDLLSIGE